MSNKNRIPKCHFFSTNFPAPLSVLETNYRIRLIQKQVTACWWDGIVDDLVDNFILFPGSRLGSRNDSRNWQESEEYSDRKSVRLRFRLYGSSRYIISRLANSKTQQWPVDCRWVRIGSCVYFQSISQRLNYCCYFQPKAWINHAH